MDWIYSIDDPLLETIAGSIIVFLGIVILTRIIGLRSFAKFTAYDFAFTVAIGSIVSSILTSSTSIAHGIVAIGSLLVITYFMSLLQRKFPSLSRVTSNKPLLLMDGSTILEDNLKHAHVERSQLMAKLREANVYQLDKVLAVVLESTGDISVLHKTEEDHLTAIDNQIIKDVQSSV